MIFHHINRKKQMRIRKFEDLACWQQARILSQLAQVYCKKSHFCKDFGLVDQIKRSSGSVMDNIAEGFERGGNREFMHFLFISKASNAEVRSQLYRALDNDYITEQEFKEAYSKSIEIKILISSLIKSLKPGLSNGLRNPD